jgi:ribosome biogenesis GTPase A
MIGTIPEELVDQEELACRLLSFLTRNYANTLSERYGVVVTSEQSLEEAHDLLAVLAKKRGCLQTGGSLDLLRMARILFDDFRSGKLGRITLELPLDEIH